MQRHALSDEQWERLQLALPTKRFGPKSKIGERQFIDAILYRGKTGIPWRDLPSRFGPWKSVYNRFNNWSKRGHFTRIFKALRLRIDTTGSIVDGSSVRAHQDASGGKGGSSQTVWVVVEEASRRRSTPSPMQQVVLSTSR
jgi:transposase